MQLHINREEKQEGMFKKKTRYVVKFRIEASEEERTAIKALGVEDYIFFESTLQDEGEIDMSPKVKGALHPTGTTRSTKDLLLAQQWENDVKEGAKAVADKVREYLEHGSGEKEEVIDL